MKHLMTIMGVLFALSCSAQQPLEFYSFPLSLWPEVEYPFPKGSFGFNQDDSTYKAFDGYHSYLQLPGPGWRFGDWDTLGTAENIREELLDRAPVCTTVTTNSAGASTWTFPNEFDFTPVISAVALDNTANTLVNVKVTALSTTSVSVQVEKVSIVLGVLTLAGTPGATLVHLTAIAP